MCHFKVEKVSRRFVMQGDDFPTTAAVGRNRDSCRLWHEEQELEEALALRRGEVRNTQNH